jgi:nucleoid-associated protein YgaU
MKMPTIIKRKKLRAATARRSGVGLPDGMDYEEMGEPNMKLSRALLIVLLLHIVAVAGIVAFNTIKTRETMNASVPETAAPIAVSPAPKVAAEPEPPTVANEITEVTDAKVSKGPAKPIEQPKAATKAPSVADSGRLYTVVKGDNPVTIARHLHVSYDALLELNQITDPRRLQIGQKLRIPERKEGSRHGE